MKQDLEDKFMPQVSKNPIDQKTKHQIFDYLYDLIAKMIRKDYINMVVGSLLTRTEKMMIAKRIAVLILLDQGWSSRHISLTLKMSTATITKLKSELEGGNRGFEEIVRTFRNDKRTSKIVEHLTNILEAIIGLFPPQKSYIRRYK